MLERGQYSVGSKIAVEFTDGDKTICKVLGENDSRTGIKCLVLENYGESVSYPNGEKRVFKYGNNPSRTIREATPINMCEEKKSFVRKLSATLKRVLNPQMQVMYKAGFIDDTLELTSEGKRELRALTYAKFEAELAERAKEVVAELEAEKE
jgi:hypothetical protein